MEGIMSNVKNDPKYKNGLLQAIRAQLEHRAFWLYLLCDEAKKRGAEEIIAFGTGAVEIKSGYGLTLEDEIKMLRVAKRVDEQTPLTVKTTFLGAHAVPARYAGRKDEYVDEIVREMIPAVAAEGLADYVDIFCEEGFFSVEDSEKIFEAGIKYGMRPKVHANQMSFSGGVQVGVKYGARSVDHLEFPERKCTGGA